jgi:hypothetical protein
MRFKQGEKATMNIPVMVKSIDKENFILTMVASTQTEDRHGDVVMQDGWDLTNYNKNPVILNSHNYGDATEVIAKAVRSEIIGTGKSAKLEQDWKFAVNENPKAKIIFDLYAGGYLNASSVGFIPKEFGLQEDKTTDWSVITRAELLEVSAVSVPANARALAKAKGIDTDVLGEDEKDINNLDNKEENDNEISKDNEVEEDIKEDNAGDNNSSEDGLGNGDEAIVGDEPIAEEKSYKEKVYGAINSINEKEKEAIVKASKILKNILEEEQTILDTKIASQVRKRKIHQAIRTLIKSK